MNIAKIHVWKVPVLLYGDLADRVLIYIHGQGGRKEEAGSFAEIATNYGWQVISVDLPEHGERKDKARFVPWEVIPELQKIMKSAKENWKVIGIYACSIGAYFSIQAFQNTKPDICLLVSPVLDMENMISNMMLQAQVTEEQLKERREIKTETGMVLSWKYLCWVREHPVKSICKETDRIEYFLNTGKILQGSVKRKSAINMEVITENTVIEPNVVCSEKYRAFFIEKIGKSFSFNVLFQKWLKSNAGQTYGDAIEAYYQILEEKKKRKTVIDKQFEYNTYIRKFFAANQGRSLEEAIVCWKYKKSLPGHNHYEKSDLMILLNT